MLRAIDEIANTNRLRDFSEAVFVLYLGLTVCVLLLQPWPFALVALLLSFAISLLVARVQARVFLRAHGVPLGFILVGAAGLCVTVSLDRGVVVQLSLAGAKHAAQLSLRAVAALSLNILVACVVPVAQLLRILQRLRCPEALLDVVLVAYRFLFLLNDAGQRVNRASRNRLGDASLKARFHAIALTTTMVYLSAIERSNRLVKGLSARGCQEHLQLPMPPSKTKPLHLLVAVAIPAAIGTLGLLLHGEEVYAK